MKQFLFFLMLIVLAGCGGNASTPTSTATPMSTYHIGDPVTVPGWTVTITAASVAQSNGSFSPIQANDQFLILSVTLENTSDAPHVPSDTPFGCRQTDGTACPLIEAGVPALASAVPVAAGGVASGQVTFEAANGARHFLVFYSVAAIVAATWDISV